MGSVDFFRKIRDQIAYNARGDLAKAKQDMQDLFEQINVPNEYIDYFPQGIASKLEFLDGKRRIDRLRKIAESETRTNLHAKWKNLTSKQKVALISEEESLFVRIFYSDDVLELREALETKPHRKEYFYQACYSKATKCLKFLLENNYEKFSDLEENEKNRVLIAAIKKDEIALFEWIVQNDKDVEKFRSMKLHGRCKEFADRYFAAKDLAQNLEATLTTKPKTTTKSGKTKI